MKAKLFLTILLMGVSPAMASSYYTYISIYGENRIAVYKMDPESGKLTHQHDVAVSSAPGPLAVDPKRQFLFAGLRNPSSISSFRIDPKTAWLSLIGAVSVDDSPAYIATDRTGRYLLSAYYSAGKAGIHPIKSDGSVDPNGKFNDTARTAHAIMTDPSNKFVFVPHPGPNAIFQFLLNLDAGTLTPNTQPKVTRPEKTGPRHIVFHPTKDIAYLDNEQGCSVTVYTFNRSAGTLEAIQTVSTLPDGYTITDADSNADVEITPDGKFVYVSNRGYDSIAGFVVDVETGKVTSLGQTPTEKTPREFNIDPTGNFLFAAGEGGDKLAAYRIDPNTGKLNRFETYTVGKKPWWVLVVEMPG